MKLETLMAQIIFLCKNETYGKTFTKKKVKFFQKKLGIKRDAKKPDLTGHNLAVLEECAEEYKKILLWDDSLDFKDLKFEVARVGIHGEFVFKQIENFLQGQRIRLGKILEQANSIFVPQF